MNTNVRACVDINARACTYACVDVNLCTRAINLHRFVCTYVYLFTYTHTHIDIYIYVRSKAMQSLEEEMCVRSCVHIYLHKRILIIIYI